MELNIESLIDLEKAADLLLSFAKGRLHMAFYGEIGAGKTTFIKQLCKRIGSHDEVTSPTFSLVNQYLYVDKEGREQIAYHMDLYRLKTVEEALDIGLEDYIYGDSYCFIEWPEIVESLLPEDVIRIRIEIVSNSMRKILFL